MRDGAECDDDFQAWHGGQFSPEMAVALANLCGARFVGWRQATHGVGDTAIEQLHGRICQLVRAKRLRCAGKAETVQGRIEQFAGNIAGKWAPGTIGALFAGAEAKYQQFRVNGAKSWHRTSMPMWVALADGGQMSSQTRTGDAVVGVCK